MTTYRGLGTTRIGVKPATNVLHAVRFASDRGQPLNVCVTFGWHWVNLGSGQAKEVFRDLRRRVRRRWSYLRDKRGLDLEAFDDVGSHEAPRDRANTHWMVRVPPSLRADFELTVERLLGKLLPEADLTRVLHFQDIYAPGSLARYVLKGIHPAFQGYFRIEAEDQGFVEGRGRTFASRSIGKSGRQAANWKRTRRRAGAARSDLATGDQRPPT